MNTQKAIMQAGSICLKAAIFILVFLGIVYLGQTTYRFTHAVFCEEAYEEAPGRNVKIKLSEDVSIKKFTKVLEKNDVIGDAVVLQVQMKFKGFCGPIRAGSYELNTSMTPDELIKALAESENTE